ncbi:MAG: hypothetical protein HY318_00080 [Armatimonadetes bacterium]|nr:hypothetical protein [Armatimonadota bacterium]
MSTILRSPGSAYKVTYDKVPLSVVANSERHFPKEWIVNDTDVSDAFLDYASPFVGELLDMTKLDLDRRPEKKLREYVPQAFRK